MHARRPLFVLAIGLSAPLFGAACGDANDPPVDATQQPLISTIGTIFQQGMLVTFSKVVNPTSITLSQTVGLAACDTKALYAVQQEAVGFTLWFSNDSGQNWVREATPGKGPEIACDHAMLLTLDSAKTLYTAPLSANGTIGSWTAPMESITVDRIQGGDGTFYGVKQVGTGYQVYVASNRATSATPTWSGPIATIGAPLVTGTGTTTTGSDNLAVSNSLAWPRRAYALESNGTVSMNDTLLAGANLWTGLNTGSERYTVLTAAAPNMLYGLQTRNGVRELDQITMKETACTDTANGVAVDNDGNGLRNSEDPACTQVVASAYCAAHGNGRYCADRYQPATFLDQANQNTSLLTCSNGTATVTPGVCVRNANSFITNADSLASLSSLRASEPAGTGHWCNVHWSDGTWGFSWTGSTPCRTLTNSKAGGKIVRAGLYSTTGTNNALANCSDGVVILTGTGTGPLQQLNSVVGHGTNRCIVTVAPAALPIFSRMFSEAFEVPNRVANPFHHNVTMVSLSQFGNGEVCPGTPESACSAGVDHFGKNVGGGEFAYDHALDEGRPLFAVAGGVVIANGSRDRDLTTTAGCGGTPNQGEIYVRYEVGADSVYRESFVVYYAHVRKQLVAQGQTVKAGQILGYVGATGCTGGFAHLHTTVHRLSNVNAHAAGAPEFGYHVAFLANNDSSGNNVGNNTATDALGWAAPTGIDPWGYIDRNASTTYGFDGIGAWNINLFKSGQQFDYP